MIVAKSAYEALIKYALSKYPIESCGILAGDGKRALEFFPVRNLDESRISYFMDPAEQIGVFKRIRTLGLVMMAIFHSHIEASAELSLKDIKLAFYANVSYVVASLRNSKGPVLESYKIEKGVAIKEKVSIV